MKRQFGKTRIELIEGDITELQVDAIVNAANSMLAHGGGVAGAIVRKGGMLIRQESDMWVRARGPVPAGSVAITSGGNLPSRYVIHAVGPRMGDGNEDDTLRHATLRSLETVEKHNLKTVSFPAIGAGISGYPIERCARVMLSAVVQYVQQKRQIEKIVFCLYGKEAYLVFKDEFVKLTTK